MLNFFFRFNPTTETIVATSSAMLMIPVYFIGTHYHNLMGLFIFTLFGNLLLNVLFPIYYITFIKKSTLADIGITKHLWKTSLLLSLILAGISIPQLLHFATKHSWTMIIHHLVFNGLSLWEPFFVFGWLLLCFDRAFGAVFGVVLAISCFLLYHIGSYPLQGMIGLGIAGIMLGILFRFTKNILVLWPLGWAVSSSIGTLQGGLVFSLNDIFLYLIILIVQLIIITYSYRHPHHLT